MDRKKQKKRGFPKWKFPGKAWGKIRIRIESNEIGKRLYQDYGYRTLLTTLPSLTINLAYMIYNGVFGILNRSAWFVTMAVYYCLIGIMRFLAVRTKARTDRMEDCNAAMAQEYRVLKWDGILLLLLTFALGGIITLTIADNAIGARSDVMAITIASYTFYKIIQAVMNMIKVRKMDSPILTSIRNIGFADALVSMISLQNILILSFESEGQEGFLEIMNGILGLAICVIVVVMGIRMVWKALKNG